MIHADHRASLARLREQGWLTQAQAEGVLAELAHVPVTEEDIDSEDACLLAWLVVRGVLTQADLDATLKRLQQSLSLDELGTVSYMLPSALKRVELVRRGISWESIASLHQEGLITDSARAHSEEDTTWCGVTPVPPEHRLATLAWCVGDHWGLKTSEVDELIAHMAQDPARAEWLPALRESKARRERGDGEFGDPAQDADLLSLRCLTLITPAQFDAAVVRMKAEDADGFAGLDDGLCWLLCHGVVEPAALRSRVGGAGDGSDEDEFDESPSAQVRRGLAWFELAQQGITSEAVQQLCDAIGLSVTQRIRIQNGLSYEAPQQPDLVNTANWMMRSGKLSKWQTWKLRKHLKAIGHGTASAGVQARTGAAPAPMSSSPGATAEQGWPVGRLIVLVLIGVALYAVWQRYH